MRIKKVAAGGWHSACISQYDDYVNMVSKTRIQDPRSTNKNTNKRDAVMQ